MSADNVKKQLNKLNAHACHAWMHTHKPNPRPNDSPIKMQRVAQTQIEEEKEQPAQGDDGDDGGQEEDGEEECGEDDPTVDGS